MALLATRSSGSLFAKLVLATIFFTALTILKTYPLVWHFGTQIPGGPGDPQMVTWILAWNVHSLTTDPLNLFNTNIFYPVQNTLALSEHMIGVAPIFAPAYLLTGNPIIAYNLVLFSAFIFSGLTMFLLVHHWTGNFWGSFLSGCLFAFAPIRFAELGHLQLANFYWAPLALLFLDRFVWSKRWSDMTWFAVFYWLQMLASVYLGWFITIGVAVYVVYHTIYIDRDLLDRAMIPCYVVFIVGSLVVLLPFHLPYYTIQQQWGFSTGLQECIYWAADPILNYLSPPYSFNDVYLSFVQSYFPRLLNPVNQQMLFPGFVLSFLMVVGSLAGRKCLAADKSPRLHSLLRLLLISSLLLSLGPFLVILGMPTSIPLPYLLFYYLIPGFQAMRVPGRFALMATLAATVLAGLGFLKATAFFHGWPGLKRLSAPRLQGLMAFCWMGLFFLELGFKPLPLAGIPTGQNVPEVYRWLAANEIDGPIMELPLGESFWEALTYMYFSTYHWRPMVNGTSRFLPPPHAQLNAEMASLPSFETVQLLAGIGVKLLVVHTDQLTPQEAARWQDAHLTESGIAEVARFGSDVVYRLPPTDAALHRDLGLAIPDHQPNGEEIRLPAGAVMRYGLIVESRSRQLWAHPPPFGRTQVRIQWEEVTTGAVYRQWEKVGLPLVVKAGDIWATGLPIQTPSAPGRYQLSLDVPALDLKAGRKLVQISSEGYQTSANTFQSLSAAYILEEPSSTPITSPIIDVSLLATNTGPSIWLAEAKHDRGKVRLGWRWFRGKSDVPFKEGREDLRYDVFPGQPYRFKTRINAPLEPGEYALELGLVSELLTWFSDRGVAPLKFDVRVPSAEGPSSP